MVQDLKKDFNIALDQKLQLKFDQISKQMDLMVNKIEIKVKEQVLEVSKKLDLNKTHLTALEKKVDE